ncbi:hypothetical protein KP509_37G062600 [Ceratopteris richardii]|uniref:Uncharacterized protein n=1 Tax=Ceratopteris richardii TaxID=49495 RepID=A0A8T2QA02_CERRI|nr:hypothetical protein KP509_37G062600 [Ceratopteris richardii]
MRGGLIATSKHVHRRERTAIILSIFCLPAIIGFKFCLRDMLPQVEKPCLSMGMQPSTWNKVGLQAVEPSTWNQGGIRAHIAHISMGLLIVNSRRESAKTNVWAVNCLAYWLMSLRAVLCPFFTIDKESQGCSAHLHS